MANTAKYIQDSGTAKCLLKESVNLKSQNSKALGVLEGVCSDFNCATRNTNYYSKKLWENVLNSDYFKEAMQTKTLFGEIDHPWDDRLEISGQEAAICCTSLTIDEDENCLRGTFDILPTEKGKLLKALCDYGSILGVSSRGLGDTYPDENGNNRVDENGYLFVCFDAVVQPAAVKARQEYKALTEGEHLAKVKPALTALVENVKSAKSIDTLNNLKNIAERLEISNNTDFTSAYEATRKAILENASIPSKDLEVAYAEIASLKERLNRQNSNRQMDADIDLIRTIVKENNKYVVEIKKSLKEQTNLFDELTDSTKQLTEARNTINEYETQIKSLTEQLNTANKIIERDALQITDLTEKVDYAKQFAGSCKNTIHKLNEDNSTLKQTIAEKDKKLSESEQVVAKYRQELSKKPAVEAVDKSIKGNLILEYVNMKESETGLDLSTLRKNVGKIRSLGEVDVYVNNLYSDSFKSKDVNIFESHKIDSIQSSTEDSSESAVLSAIFSGRVH